MKRGLVVIDWVLMVFFSSLPLMAQEACKPGPWVKINERDGITAYTRVNPRASQKEGLVFGVVDGSVAMIENMMRDWDAYKKVLFMSKKTEPVTLPGYTATQDTRYAYLLQGAPWPVDDRDGVARLQFYYDKPTNQVLVTIRLVCPDYPLTKGVTRIPFCEMEWIIKPMDATHSLVAYQNILEPGGKVGSMPAPVVNYVMKHFGIFTIQNIRKLTKEEKYHHATQVITQTPWPTELRSYAELPNNS